MTRRSGSLEEETLLLFKLACRENRLDVAEHFLRALEILEREPGPRGGARCQSALAEAYMELVRTVPGRGREFSFPEAPGHLTKKAR